MDVGGLIALIAMLFKANGGMGRIPRRDQCCEGESVWGRRTRKKTAIQWRPVIAKFLTSVEEVVVRDQSNG